MMNNTNFSDNVNNDRTNNKKTYLNLLNSEIQGTFINRKTFL